MYPIDTVFNFLADQGVSWDEALDILMRMGEVLSADYRIPRFKLDYVMGSSLAIKFERAHPFANSSIALPG